jgi:hypothetical protein
MIVYMEVYVLTQDQYIKGRLVELSWRFSKSYIGAGHIAGQMIMHTLANRVRVGWGSYLQVIDRVPSFMAEKELPKLEHPPIWEPGFIKLLHAVDGIYDGSIPDLSKGALYWGELSKIERPWFQTQIVDALDENGLRRHPVVSNMNGLVFFR